MRALVFLFVGLLVPFFPGGTRNPTDCASPKTPGNETTLQSHLSDAVASAGQQPAQAPPVIRSNVNEVIVPVVVRDAQGRAVPNLSKADFQVFDNRKPQTITGFTIIKRTAETAAANSSAGSPDLGNSSTASPPASSPSSLCRLSLRRLQPDIRRSSVRKAIRDKSSGFLARPCRLRIRTFDFRNQQRHDPRPRKIEAGDFGSEGQHALLRTNKHDCPNIDYYQGDRIVNKSDDQALQAAVIETAHCLKNITLEAAEALARTAGDRAVQLGEQNYRANLSAVRLILNDLMARLPGDHIIILVSSGFFAPGPDAAVIKSEVLNLAARTNTVINTLDARGLYTTNTGAEVTTRVDEASQRLLNQIHVQSMDSNADVLSELADGSGGIFYHNNNDLEAGLKTLISGAEYRYLLAFSPSSTKPRVQHTLKIKVNQPGLTVQARRGYSISPPEKHNPQTP